MEQKRGVEGAAFKRQSGKYNRQREKQICKNDGGIEDGEGEIPRE